MLFVYRDAFPLAYHEYDIAIVNILPIYINVNPDTHLEHSSVCFTHFYIAMNESRQAISNISASLFYEYCVIWHTYPYTVTTKAELMLVYTILVMY